MDSNQFGVRVITSGYDVRIFLEYVGSFGGIEVGIMKSNDLGSLSLVIRGYSFVYNVSKSFHSWWTIGGSYPYLCERNKPKNRKNEKTRRIY